MKRAAIIRNADLDWFLEASEAALGLHGTMSACTGQLELGGRPTGLPNTDRYGDEHLGWGNHLEGNVERHRRLTGRWNRLEEKHQRTLAAYYATPQVVASTDEGDVRGLPRPLLAALGALAGVAVLTCPVPKLSALLRAAEDRFKPTNRDLLALAEQRAKRAIYAAHDSWDALETEEAEQWVDQTG